MTLLPVVERELRVAARERSTYRVRFIAAFLTILFSCFSLWFVRIAFNERPIPPRELFLFLSWISYIFVAIAGFTITCDSISQEKRDSTLGLLFLTDLRGYDIVLSKFAVGAARGFYALIATVPVLALPLMMGGTNLSELARTTGVLLLTLLFSMSIGLACSSFVQKNWTAFGVSAGFLFFFAALLPAASQLLRAYYRNATLAHYLELPSPSYAMYMSFRNAIGLTGNDFVYSILIVLSVSFLAVLITSFQTPRVWQDRPPPRRWAYFLKQLRAMKYGSPEIRAQFRHRLLELNPIFWLSRRERVSSPGILAMFFLLGALAAWVGSQDWSFLNPRANVVLPFVAWIITGIAAHIFILLRLAVLASERFGEDRRTGALELILSTPISIKSILAGHWMSLRRYFAGPILMAFCFHALVFSYGFTLDDDPEFARSPLQVIGDIAQHIQGFPIHPYRWELHFFALVVLTLIPVLILDWIALAWLSTWRVLRLKHQLLAPISSLLILHLPPVVALIFTAGFIDRFHLMPSHNFSQVLLLFTIITTYLVLNQLICIAWSRRQIYKHFRTAATDRYQFTAKRAWWKRFRRSPH